MVSAESRSGKSNSYTPSRLACLAGAATVLPFAAHADSIQYSGIQNITVTATGQTATTQAYTVDFVPVDAASGFQFTASFDPVNDFSTISVLPAGSNAFVSGGSSNPTPLTAGALIDGTAIYSTGTGFLQAKFPFNPAAAFGPPLGPWPNDGSSAFLGITFTDPSANAGTSPTGVYYGWVDLSATATTASASFTITDWAYETTGNAILAGETASGTPEPSSLILFALGAAGVVAVRARRLAARS